MNWSLTFKEYQQGDSFEYTSGKKYKIGIFQILI